MPVHPFWIPARPVAERSLLMADSNITKRALAQAMKELMAEESFSKISVSDICSRCGMNRKSFYYHFQDKYDLVNWIFYTEFLTELAQKESENTWEMLEDVCSYFYREQRFYRNAIQIQGQNSFREYFVQAMEPFMLRFLQQLFSNIQDYAFATTFLSDAFLASMVRWLSEGPKLTVKEYLNELRTLLTTLAKYILAKLPEEEEAKEDET
jgi:probable dihydroxyacetone kinase regulator